MLLIRIRQAVATDKKIIYATIIGVILYVLLIYVAYVQATLALHQIILMLVTPLIIGLVSGKIKRAIILGFIISFIMLTLEFVVLQTSAFSNVNIILAILIAQILPFVLISTGIAAVGGLIGKKVIKK